MVGNRGGGGGQAGFRGSPVIQRRPAARPAMNAPNRPAEPQPRQHDPAGRRRHESAQPRDQSGQSAPVPAAGRGSVPVPEVVPVIVLAQAVEIRAIGPDPGGNPGNRPGPGTNPGNRPNPGGPPGTRPPGGVGDRPPFGGIGGNRPGGGAALALEATRAIAPVPEAIWSTGPARSGPSPAAGLGGNRPGPGGGGGNRPGPGNGVNRPGGGLVGQRPGGGGSRPGLGDNLGVGNRPNIGNNVNRPINSGNTNINRPTNNIGNNIGSNNVVNRSTIERDEQLVHECVVE